MKNKPSNCKCGNYKSAGSRWVVLKRRPPYQSSQLKCLECGWVWWNSRNYISKLPDHTERSRSGMSDEDILERIKSGTLFVETDTARVFSFNSQSSKWTELRQITRVSNGSKYEFVEVCHKGKKKKISVHRLVWIFEWQELIPEGYDVDHINGKRGLNPNGIENLQLMKSSLNRSKGCPTETMELF